ncbi:hypothetical protein F4679DRAFT_582907 [Xylaria curta]|nr:hypothetical protein F4679DRAFT_582907 [Xylaria curta]
MVHISNIVQGQRVNHTSNLIDRGQDIKVKVTKIEGSRMDVDQETPRDRHGPRSCRLHPVGRQHGGPGDPERRATDPIHQQHRHLFAQKVRHVLCSGFSRNAARKMRGRCAEDAREGYKALVEGTPVYLHPSSVLFGKQTEWIIYSELVLTVKECIHCTTSIEPLIDAAPTVFKVAPTDKLSKRKKARRIQPLYNEYATEGD